MPAVTYDEALDAVRERLSPYGAQHCVRVAETAVWLADAYGVDREDARLAGLLHDWDRDTPASRLLADARDTGVDLSADDEAVPYLLHARTGAASLAARFPGLAPQVLSAIARHTVGAPGMTDLDMVVYLADMIEPGREYHGVEELREAVGVSSLADLFALGYRRSLLHLVKKRKRIHPDTVAVWNEYVAEASQ